jgi:hypothetical protein
MTLAFDTAFPALEGRETLSEASRVRELVVSKNDGSVVTLVSNGSVDASALADTYILATNSFTATGGDGFSAFAAATVLGATSVGEQAILEGYIQNVLGGVVDVIDDPDNPERVIRLN